MSDAVSEAIVETPPSNTRARDRELAKIAMVASIGALVVTGLALSRGRGGHGMSGAHIAAGVALIGASWWHHNLYAKPRR